MLNPDLYLNPKIFEEEPDEAPVRNGYGEGLVALGEKDQNIVVLTADLCESTRSDAFAKRFPERIFECGVAEQNMAAIAAGLAVSGKTPFISSYAVFSPGKNWETIRTTIIYNNANVKIAGHHAGIITGPDGATHQATEDIAITRVWPGIKVVVPCDAIEAKKATIVAGETPGPFYLRFSRDKTPVMTSEKTPFELGKIQLFWVSKDPTLAILATGHILYYALLAARELEKEGIQTIVANVSTIKPLDEETLITLAGKTKGIITVEDHEISGGLGGAVAEILSQKQPTRMSFVGLQDTFGESGKPKELIEKYGLGTQAIKSAAKKLLG